MYVAVLIGSAKPQDSSATQQAPVVEADDRMTPTRPRRTISVTGTAERSFQTTIAVVRLGVEATGQTASQVQADVSARSQTLAQFLSVGGVERLQTTGVSLTILRETRGKQTVVCGYAGTNTVSFEVDVALAGAFLDGAVENGASQISGVSFKAEKGVMDAARKDALAAATVAAKEEAGIVAGALGVGLGEPVSVDIVGAARQGPMRMAPPPAPGGSAVVGGKSAVTASVAVVFEIGAAVAGWQRGGNAANKEG